MENSIYHLRIDFVQENGTYLLLDRELPLQSCDLISHQVHMLRANSIPGLLTMEIEETNDKFKFRYDISGKRMLSQYLKVNKMSLAQFYDWLYQILHVLDESKLYLLSTQNYVLSLDFIFVGVNGSGIHLTYLPLKEIPGKEPLLADLNRLVSSLLVYIQELKGEGVQQLLGWLQQGEMSLQELKHNVQGLMLALDRGGHGHIEEQAVKGATGGTNTTSRTSELKALIPADTGMIIESDIARKSKNTTNRVPFVPALIVIGIWLGFAFHPIEKLLYFCIGFTVLATGMSYVFFKRITGLEQSFLGSMLYKRPPASKLQMNNRQMIHEIPEHLETSMIRVSDATVWLGNEMKAASTQSGSKAMYMLQIHKNNQTEQVEIKGEQFLIGRSEADADYAEDAMGLSRIHCEIAILQEGCFVKDLGSMNGSCLNGERMAPYKSYPFRVGDVLKIIQTEFMLVIC